MRAASVANKQARTCRGPEAGARSAGQVAAFAGLAMLGLLFGGGARAAEGCSLSSGAPWHEYQSQHFVIDVAGWEGDPRHLVGAFEQLRAAVLAALIVEPVEIPGRVRVILLPRRRGLAEYTGSSDVLGLFWATPLGEPTILTSADQIDDVPQIIAHELTHYLSIYLFPRQPYWFAEGLAQFLEGIAKIDGEGRRWAGSDPMAGWWAGSVKIPHMRHLVPAVASELGTDPYVSSWILYRFLWNERGPQLSVYQQELMDGVAPAEAWTAAFPEWAGGKINLLDSTLAHYQLTGRGHRWEVKAGEVDDRFVETSAPLGDIHLTMLSLRLLRANPLDHDRLRRLAMEEAEKEDPGNPLVGAERAALQGVARLSALRAGVVVRPADGRGWYLLGKESTEEDEREAALRKAVELWPEGALAQAALAAHLAATGRAREALPFANRGVELAPYSPTTVATLASVALGLRKCEEALTLQTRAVETVESRRVGSLDADEATLRSALKAMQERCRDSAGAR